MALILVVDDEPGLREFAVDALVEAGHEVVAAPDGEAALREIELRPFELLLVDLRMPGRFDGLEVLRHVRAEWPTIPAIVLTAHGSVATAVDAMRLGAVDFLEKPVDSPDELRRMVTRALNRRQANRTFADLDPLVRAESAAGNQPDPASTLPVAAKAGVIRRFTAELRRRRVPNTAATYLAIALIALEAAQLVLPATPLPEWVYPALVSLAVACFPLVIVLGWIFDVSITRTLAASPRKGLAGG